MPIFIEELNWEQKDELIYIILPLESKIYHSIDVRFASLYIKVNSAPYFYEAFLTSKIIPELCDSKIVNGKFNLVLVKQIKENWVKLSFKPSDKYQAKLLRDSALLEITELEKKKWKLKQEKRQENERIAISKQIEKNEEIVQEQKDFIRNEKELFFQKDNDVESLRKRFNSVCSEEGITTETDYDGDEESVYCSSVENIPCLSSSNDCEEPVVLMTLEEVKNEAKSHYEDGSFEKAVRSYNKAIKLDPLKASLYGNRASAYLALNVNHKARKDCSKALSLLKPHSNDNLDSRILCYVKRGNANVRLRNFGTAVEDYKKALKLDPHNSLVAEELNTILRYLANSSDTGEEDQVPIITSFDNGEEKEGPNVTSSDSGEEKEGPNVTSSDSGEEDDQSSNSEQTNSSYESEQTNGYAVPSTQLDI